MDEELEAFRIAWCRDVAERAHGRAPNAAHSHMQAPSSDAMLKAAAPAVLPEAWADQERDALSMLLRTLSSKHVERVHEMMSQNTEDHTVWPEHVGTCISTIYAADLEVSAVPMVQHMPDELWYRILLHVLMPTPLEPMWPTMLPENMSFLPPRESWRRESGPDYVSLERVGRTCWRLRQLTSHPRLWRAIVQGTYGPPFVPLSCSWRDAYVHEPRVRMNGTYIATCEYTQQGMSEENVWVRVLHVVRFFRYLRFFPNGRCLSWLTTDEPADVVHRLEPGIRSKGCAAGHWRCLSEAGEALSRRGATILIEDLHDPTLPGYTFQMTLHMRSSPGRWHRMDMLEYASLNLQTGEVLPIPHKHARPFLFSRVLSYGV